MQQADAPAARTNRTRFALWLDALLLLLFLILKSPHISGVAAHEVIGIAIAIPVVLHLLLSWHWIVSKGRRFLIDGTPRLRTNYLINIVLFIAMFAAIITGAVISRILLPAMGIRTIYDREWFSLHNESSNVLLLAVGLHLAMNWGWVVVALRHRPFNAEEVAEVELVEEETVTISEVAGE